VGLTFYDADQVAYAAIARLFAPDLQVLEAAQEGYSIESGCQVVAGTTAGTVKVRDGHRRRARQPRGRGRRDEPDPELG